DGMIQITDLNSNYITTVNEFSENILIRGRAKTSHYAWGAPLIWGNDSWYVAEGSYFGALSDTETNNNFTLYDGSRHYGTVAISLDTWYNIQHKIYNGNWSMWNCSDNFTLCDYADVSISYPYTSGKITLQGTQSGTAYWDYIYVAKYISPEPNYTIGSEEQSTGVTITLISPDDGAVTTKLKNFFSANLTTPDGKSLKNATLYVWEPDGSLLGTNFTDSINGQTSAIVNLSLSGFYPAEGFKWAYYACSNATSEACSWSENKTLHVKAIVNSIDYNSTTYETKRETFTLNITAPEEYTPTNCKFVYDGTEYSISPLDLGNDQYLLTKTIDVPTVTSAGNKSFSFEFKLGTLTQTESYQQYVDTINFSYCDSSPFINISFQDEIATVPDNATIYSQWNYWLGSGTTYKTYAYQNTSENPYYAFCFSPSNQTLFTNVSLTYGNSDSPQRKYVDSLTLTNQTTNITLFLLSSGDGMYVTFQVLSANNEPIKDVYVTAEREIDAVWYLIESSYTDDAGSVTFWLNPNYLHRFNFTKSGYEKYVTTLIPTQSTYTVTLGSVEIEENVSYNLGITYNILPTDTVLSNGTNYTFAFNISSSYWDLEGYGFTLKDENGTTIGSAIGYKSSGGMAATTVNTDNYTKITMEYFWIINGTYMRGSTYWYVKYTKKGEFSLMKFVEDLKSFSNAGMNDFTRALIAFAIIFIVVGLVCYISGTYSPLTIAALTFFLVCALDYVGLIPQVGKVKHFIPILTGLLLIGLIIHEYRS
ncbi:MAG: hypothetical protein DRO04_02245, partial [Candidatus Iainarchaeum archaeon]